MKINENKASGASVVETLEMSQKPVVRPIERISAHTSQHQNPSRGKLSMGKEGEETT